MNKFWKDDELKNLEEVQVSHETIYDGSLLHVRRDTVRLTNGAETGREYITHPGAACIVPVTDDGKVIVERQYRYPFHDVLTEVPAGKRDAGEDFLVAAKRELREETGITADEWVDMGAFLPSCAYSDEVIQMYLARGLHKTERNLDDDEFVDIYKVPLQDLIDDIMEGKITDGKTQTALLKAWKILNN